MQLVIKMFKAPDNHRLMTDFVQMGHNYVYILIYLD